MARVVPQIPDDVKELAQTTTREPTEVFDAYRKLTDSTFYSGGYEKSHEEAMDILRWVLTHCPAHIALWYGVHLRVTGKVCTTDQQLKCRKPVHRVG
jgi:hypothetical protein